MDFLLKLKCTVKFIVMYVECKKCCLHIKISIRLVIKVMVERIEDSSFFVAKDQILIGYNFTPMFCIW